MSVAIRAITRLQDADDVNVTPAVGVDEYALCWDNDTARFVLRAVVGGGVTDHGALTGLADDDHGQYLLATGARTGASAAAQLFTSGIKGPSWKPAADSTTALQLQNATGTSVLNVDTTNGRVGIGTSAPVVQLHVQGTFAALGAGAVHPDTASIANLFHNFNSYIGLVLKKTGTNTTNDYFQIQDSTGGVKVNVSGLGNVGIGTASPATALHVVGAATITGGIRPAADSTTALQLQNAAGTSVLNVDTTNARVGIGTAAPTALFHADQSSSTGAVPVLTLDQADVSEEFIRFIGTSTTDATQSLVDAANMTTSGALKGWLKIYVQDDAASGAITDAVYFVPFYAEPTA